jgi:tetratricopeptide (TPR) repeat protein
VCSGCYEENGMNDKSTRPGKFPNKLPHGAETMAKYRKSPKALAVFLFGFIFLSVSPAFSNLYDSVPDVPPGTVGSKDPIFFDAVSPGIDLILHDRFKEGLLLFEKIQQSHPHHPAPHFFEAATYQGWMSFTRLKTYQAEFEKSIQLTIEEGHELLKQGNDPWILFYVGAAFGYQAFNNFRKHQWIDAYFDAKKGVDSFKEALKLDPKLFDVYLGLGSYYYWRTAKSSFLRLITFWIPDKRELGLRQLEFAFQHGAYAQNQAGYNLVAAYFDYGQYEKAMRTLNRIIERKKTAGLSDLYYRGRLLIEFKKWAEAESVFREILEHLESEEFASAGYKAECLFWIAALLTKQKKRSQALEFAEMALAQIGKRKANSELEGPFEDFGEIEANLERLHRYLKGEGKGEFYW